MGPPRVPPRLHRMRSEMPNTPRTGRSTPRGGPRWPRFPTSAASSMFVVDPKTLATRLLVKPVSRWHLEETNTRLVRCFVWLKNISERWFTHFLLLVALILYACLGGLLFSTIEGNAEKEQNEIIAMLHKPIEQKTEKIVEDLWLYRNNFELPTDLSRAEPVPPVNSKWHVKVLRSLGEFEETVREQCDKRLNYSIDTFYQSDHWNFIGSVFFSMTVFSTIGYGDNPPRTTGGKAATMIYSFIGIPLLLMVLADFGKILTKTIKFVVLFFRRLYYLRTFRSVRHMSRSARIQNAILETLSKVQRQPPFYVDPQSGRVTLLPPPQVSAPQSNSGPTSGAEMTTRQQAMHPLQRVPRVTLSPATPGGTLTPETPMPAEVMQSFDELDDEFNLPISLALVILLLYLFFGAIIFWSSENWTLFQAFYFVFISMSTIGFGDFVPSRIHVLLYAFIYLIFGLALTSMCINVIQEKLSSTFEKARITIGETIGLDPTTPITIVVPPQAASNSTKSSPSNSRKTSVQPESTAKQKPSN